MHTHLHTHTHTGTQAHIAQYIRLTTFSRTGGWYEYRPAYRTLRTTRMLFTRPTQYARTMKGMFTLEYHRCSVGQGLQTNGAVFPGERFAQSNMHIIAVVIWRGSSKSARTVTAVRIDAVYVAAVREHITTEVITTINTVWCCISRVILTGCVGAAREEIPAVGLTSCVGVCVYKCVSLIVLILTPCERGLPIG
jgi:hypothetical protein